MEKISYNKSSLQKQREQLKLYERLLPSLDLKRRQLMGEFARAKKHLVKVKREVEKYMDHIGDELPMLGCRGIDVTGLVKAKSIQIGEENVVGVKLPVFLSAEFETVKYSMLVKPFWVDVLVDRLKKIVELETQEKVARERVNRLDHAVRRITQRVNLFEKILIPRAKHNISRIRIFLGDAERASVVRSKQAKRMRIIAREAQMIGQE